MCVVVSTGYFALGALCLRAFVHVARARGSLKLT
jgi:hypothetical protein